MSATAALLNSIQPNPVDVTQQEFIVDGTVTLAGNYPTNGDTLSLAGLGIPSNQLPTKVELFEATPAPGPATGLSFVFVPGTTQANGLLEVFSGSTQESTATYASILGAVAATFVLRFRAWFPKFV